MLKYIPILPILTLTGVNSLERMKDMNVTDATVAMAAMAVIMDQAMTTNEAQMAMLKNMADSQKQMVEILQALGIGQNVNVHA